MVGRSSRRSGIGQEAFWEVREWSGGNPRGPGVVGRPSRRSGRPTLRSGSGLEALPKVREWSGGPHKDPEIVGRHSRRSGSGWEALTKVRK